MSKFIPIYLFSMIIIIAEIAFSVPSSQEVIEKLTHEM